MTATYLRLYLEIHCRLTTLIRGKWPREHRTFRTHNSDMQNIIGRTTILELSLSSRVQVATSGENMAGAERARHGHTKTEN